MDRKPDRDPIYPQSMNEFHVLTNAARRGNVVKKCLRTIDQGLSQRNYTVIGERVTASFDVNLPFLKSDCDICVKGGPREKEEEVVKILITSESGSEFTIQGRLFRQPNVVSLFWVPDACDGETDGLLTLFLYESTLNEISSLTTAQKFKRNKQILETVNFLRDSETVWGDAAVQNVMIIQLNDRGVLIDFGGGITRGFIDDDLFETKQGDLERLHVYVDNLDLLNKPMQTK